MRRSICLAILSTLALFGMMDMVSLFWVYIDSALNLTYSQTVNVTLVASAIVWFALVIGGIKE